MVRVLETQTVAPNSIPLPLHVVLELNISTVIPRKLAVPNSRNPQTRDFCCLVTENPQIDILLVK